MKCQLPHSLRPVLLVLRIEHFPRLEVDISHYRTALGMLGQSSLRLLNIRSAKKPSLELYRLCPWACHLDFSLARVAEMSQRRKLLTDSQYDAKLY
jgi:hypothetical protein